MLTQEYTYYIFKVLLAGLPSIPGALFMLFLLGAVYGLLNTVTGKGMLTFWVCLILAIAAGLTTFYTAVYEFDENPQALIAKGAPQNDEECGTAWSNWAKGGYGMGNTCPKGCYRGLTLRKQLSMSGFPPWPNYRREMQCLKYED